MRTERAVAPLLVGVLLLTCVSAGAGAPARASTSNVPSTGPSTFSTDVRLLPRGTEAVPLAPGQPVEVGFTLGYSHPAALAGLLTGVSDPMSGDYRHYLTYPQFEAAFAPPSASVSQLVAALRAAGGVSIALRPGSSTVEAVLTAADLEALLGISGVVYPNAYGGSSYTFLGTPRLPTALRPLVDGVEGLSGSAGGPQGIVLTRTLARGLGSGAPAPQFVVDLASGADWYLGSDYTQAYQATSLLPGYPSSVPHAVYPYHVAVATLLASSYNSSFDRTLPPFAPAVVNQYFADTLASGWPRSNVTGIPVNEPGTAIPPLPGAFGIYNDSLGMETENSLDLEMAGSMAPGAPLYNFYFSGSLLSGPASTLAAVAGYLSDDLATALSHNYTPARLGVVSCSFGLPDVNNSAWNSELIEAAAMGVTVVAASGDQGNAADLATGRSNGPNPLWPATAAFNTSGVVSVGGVTPSLGGTANGNYSSPPLVAHYDPLVQGLSSTVAWFDASGGFGDYAGTEGGISSVFAEPYWQYHSAAQPNIVTEAQLQGVGSLGRAGPDVAFPANATVAYIAESRSAQPVFAIIEGTSVAAPLFAGMVADTDAVESAVRGQFTALGYLDPELYRIASYFAANGSVAALDPFVGVTNGSNALFNALPGWDALTGWGGVLAPLLLAADQNPAARSYLYTGPTPNLPPAPVSDAWIVTAAIVVSAIAVPVAVAGVVLWRRRTAPPPAPDIFDQYLEPGGGYGNPMVAPPTFATFACPFCGSNRPAEAGPCPSCGAL